jgi:hypothetical protein
MSLCSDQGPIRYTPNYYAAQEAKFDSLLNYLMTGKVRVGEVSSANTH